MEYPFDSRGHPDCHPMKVLVIYEGVIVRVADEEPGMARVDP